jgi:hypothetical protein
MIRGFMQGCIEQLLTSRRRREIAILLASVQFGVVHLHYSFGLGMLAIGGGILFGGLYARHRTTARLRSAGSGLSGRALRDTEWDAVRISGRFPDERHDDTEVAGIATRRRVTTHHREIELERSPGGQVRESAAKLQRLRLRAGDRPGWRALDGAVHLHPDRKSVV